MTTDKEKKETPKKAVTKKAADKKVSRATGKPIVEKSKSKAKPPRRAPTKEVVGAVEKSVPIPEDKPKGKYPLDSMGPGESFLVQCAPKNAKRIRLSIMGASRRVSTKTGTEFLVQIRPEEGGVRCWRTTPEKPQEKPIVLSESAEVEVVDSTPGPAPVASPFKLPIP